MSAAAALGRVPEEMEHGAVAPGHGAVRTTVFDGAQRPTFMEARSEGGADYRYCVRGPGGVIRSRAANGRREGQM
jgi:hypothetical protein